MAEAHATPSITLNPDLIDTIARGECVLFFGDDDRSPLPTGDWAPGRQAFAERLTARLPAELRRANATPWEVAEDYQVLHGRHALVQEFRNWSRAAGSDPYPIHRAVARLPLEAIITTCQDGRLEQALKEAGKAPVTVVADVDVPFVGSDKVLVLKLFGDAEQPDTLVLTDADLHNLKTRLRALLSVVRYLFVIKTLFFVRHDLNDAVFKDLYAEVAQGLGKYQRRGYALWPGANELDRARWGAKGIELMDAQAGAYLEHLAGQLAQRPPGGEPVEEPFKLLNRRPYLFLKYFELDDAEVFFGRETESLLLWRKILSYRLVVLFGASGAGKSSLLNAGVWPRLTPYGFRVCSVRVGGDPAAEVRKEAWAALHPGAGGDPGPEREGLASFFARAMAEEQRLVVFVDQFEELFVNLAPKVQASFLRDLAQCVRELPRQVRFVLALREDFLPQLEAQRDLLLQYDANSFRLEALGRAAAELAITEPAHRVGLAYEPALVQTLLDDLAEGGRIAPPQLQIVCDRLYDRAVGAAESAAPQALAAQTGAIFALGKPAQEARAAITCEQYQALGGARTLLADYVGERIAALPEAQREPARAILKAMITGEETKAVLAEAAIAQRARLEAVVVEETLANLVQDRLVRRLQGEPDTLYELAHEHMIAKIRSWVGQQERDAEFARKLLVEQLGRWRKLGEEGLIDLDTLKRIDAQRENPYFVLTADAELELVFRSALTTGYEVPYWREHAPAVVGKVEQELFGGLASKDAGEAEKAVKGLAALASTEIVERLAALVDGGFGARELTWIDHQGKSHAVRNSVLNLGRPAQRRAALALAKMVLPEATAALARWTPPGMVLIPAGPFTMGSTTAEGAGPVHEVPLDAFWIDRYPVTNAQWAAFLAADPWRKREWWTDAGWKCVGVELRTEPDEWSEPRKKLDHPVQYVRWYESLAYARWAGKALLNEAQWEKAARGTDGRCYPWGDTFDKNKCNTRESDIGDTTPVGKYSKAGGDSPYGVADMAGNVWEWCRNLYVPYRYNAGDGREVLEGTGSRVLRGGSWHAVDWFAAAFFRFWGNPGAIRDLFGFRVCAVLPPP